MRCTGAAKLSLIEWNAFRRRPVIATALGGPTEMIIDGESGFLIPPANPGEFANRLQRLIEDKSLRERIGKAARRRIHEHFPASAFDQKVGAMAQSILCG